MTISRFFSGLPSGLGRHPIQSMTGRLAVRGAVPLMVVLLTMMMLAPAQGGHVHVNVLSPQDVLEPVQSPVEEGGHFIKNMGQWDTDASFVARTSFGHVVLGMDGITYDVAIEEGGHRLKVVFDAEGGVEPEGMYELGFPTNYFIGNDPDQWVIGARSFREVIYKDVWPGIDVRYRFSGDHLKYDLLLDADADPSVIRFQVDGSIGLEINDGGLEIHLSSSLSIMDSGLDAWYGNGERAEVRFRLDGDGFGFDVDKIDGRTMVIDPVILHASTYVGGTYGEWAEDLQIDKEGNIILAGWTSSSDYPTTPGAYAEEGGYYDVVITKMNHNCSKIVWSTFLGGTNMDFADALEVDNSNNIYISGRTWSKDFPVTKGAYAEEANLGTGWSQIDIYITKLTPNGASLVYSTYLGGTGPEQPYDIEVRNGKLGLAGWMDSLDFPTTTGSHAANFGAAILLVMSANGSQMENCWVWDGIGGEAASSLEWDRNGDIVVAGYSSSPVFMTTPGVYQPSKPTRGVCGFVARYSVTQDRLIFCTWLGGAEDMITSVEVDRNLNVYVGGVSRYGGAGGPVYPTTLGAFDREYNGWREGFVTKMDPQGTRLIYSTLLGGDGDDIVRDIEVDADGNLVAVGSIESGNNFTVTADCHDPNWSGEGEGFVVHLNSMGTGLKYSSFHGGSYEDEVVAVEFDGVDNYVVMGTTLSNDIPVAMDGFQTRYAGGQDMFVSVIGELLPPSAPRSLRATGHEGYIELDWSAPLYDYNYPVREYHIYKGTSEDDLRPYQVLDDVLTFVDDEVEWGVLYHYAVHASNWKGVSPGSNVVSARSVTVPDPPVNMTAKAGLDGVSVEWVPPQFTGGLPLTEFRLYRQMEGGQKELVATIGPEVWAYEDAEAEDGTMYTYILTAANEFGESRRGVNVTLRTTDVPTPPLGLDHTYGDMFIRLTWGPPVDDFGLHVTDYEVYRQTGEGPVERIGQVTVPALNIVDDQVSIGVVYNYYVTARNAKGPSVASEVIEAMVMLPPDPPTDVKAMAMELFIRVTWSPPVFDGASTVLGYRVYLGGTETEALYLGGMSIEGADGPQLVFLHDVPYDNVVREYFVTAVNAEGESDPSEVVATMLYELPTAPRSLAIAWGDGQLSLEWQPPAADGGTPVISYSIYRRGADGVGYDHILTLPPGIHDHFDDTTDNGVEYAYRVTAINMIGESIPSQEVAAVPAGRPGVPLDVVAEGLDGAARVTWRSPGMDGGRAVEGYRVYAILEGINLKQLAEIGPDEMEFVQTGLVNGMVYIYAVRAFTEAGASELSDIVEARPVGLPSPPRDLEAKWMAGHIRLTWNRSQDDGGSSVQGYRLHRDDWEEANWTNVGDPVFLDHDVEPGKTYNYTVHAYTDVGSSPVSTITFTVPREEEPPVEPEVIKWSYVVLLVVLITIAAALVIVGRQRKDGDSDNRRI